MLIKRQSMAQDPLHLLDEKEHTGDRCQDRDEFYEPILFEAFNYIFPTVFEALTTRQHALNGWIAQKRKDSVQKAAMRGVIGEYDMISAFQRYAYVVSARFSSEMDSARLRSLGLCKMKPQSGSRQHPKPLETRREAGAVRQTDSTLRIFRL